MIQYANFLRMTLGFFLLATSLARAQDYALTDLGLGDTSPAINDIGTVTGTTSTQAWKWQSGVRTYLGSLGGGTSVGTSINAKGTIVGYSYNGAYLDAFAYSSSGVFTDLGRLLGGNQSAAMSVNDFGAIVGYSYTGDSDNFLFHAALWSDGTISDLATLAGSNSEAHDVNNAGVIVGTSDNVAFEYTTSSGMQSLGTLPGAAASTAWAINSAGVVVGHSEVPGPNSRTHAVVWDAGTITDLGVLVAGPVSETSEALDINSAGVIVGDSTIDSGAVHAFVYDPVRGMQDLNLLVNAPAGWTLTTATAINDLGQIVGLASVQGQTHVFLLSPQAVPTSIPRISISVSSPEVSEGAEATFTISASSINPAPISVGYSVSGHANQGQDYLLSGPTQEVIIPAGQSSATIVLHALLDNLSEKNETVKMKLTRGAGYKLSTPKTAAITIVNTTSP